MGHVLSRASRRARCHGRPHLGRTSWCLVACPGALSSGRCGAPDHSGEYLRCGCVRDRRAGADILAPYAPVRVIAGPSTTEIIRELAFELREVARDQVYVELL